MWQTFVAWWIFATSWEWITFTSTGHLSVSHRMSVDVTQLRSQLFTYQVKTFIASTNVCRINWSWKHYDKYSLGFFYSAELLARSSDARIAGTWLLRSWMIILCVYSWTFTVQNYKNLYDVFRTSVFPT